MKQIIIGACCILLMIYAVYINENFIDTTVRRSELSMALVHGINQTLEAHKEEAFESETAMEQYFMRLLKIQVTSDSVVKANIISSSCKYGILDVEVIEYFQTSDQKEREIVVRKCGIIDEQTPKASLVLIV